jgi:hypothetical protein
MQVLPCPSKAAFGGESPLGRRLPKPRTHHTTFLLGANRLVVAQPGLSLRRTPACKPPSDSRSWITINNCPAWRRHRTPSRRILCMPLSSTPRRATANAPKETCTRTHRSRAATGCPPAPTRTCHLEADPQQPHRLPRAGDDTLRRALCRSP